MEGFFYAIKFVYLKYYSYICYMGETAEERARRLALEQNGYVNDTRILTNGMTIDAEAELTALLSEQWLNDVCREIIDEVRDEPTVNLVKKYSKGTFKFVNEMKKVEREEYDLIINFFQ